ncbi:hypothetical protein D1007_15485 [Hordeum vulgare]|nr:hypothetical protein D1007_15485 [Hordeum vulgare]
MRCSERGEAEGSHGTDNWFGEVRPWQRPSSGRGQQEMRATVGDGKQGDARTARGARRTAADAARLDRLELESKAEFVSVASSGLCTTATATKDLPTAPEIGTSTGEYLA